MSLLAVVLGTFLHRFFLTFEEVFHLKRRYNGSWFDMWRACFSGIPWGAITVVTTVSIVIVSLSFRKDVFKMNYIVAVLFGLQ